MGTWHIQCVNFFLNLGHFLVEAAPPCSAPTVPIPGKYGAVMATDTTDQIAAVLQYLRHSRADVRALASENIAALSGSADGLHMLKRADVQRQLCEAVGDVEGCLLG